jgi:hypothetical protein
LSALQNPALSVDDGAMRPLDERQELLGGRMRRD